VLGRGAGPHALVVSGTGRSLAATVEMAADSGSRRRGLLGRAGLAEDVAFIIAPCSAVHTFGMQFPIDVIYAARDGRVVKVTERLVRSRLSAAFGAFAAIEMAAGSAARARVTPGDVLQVVPATATDQTASDVG